MFSDKDRESDERKKKKVETAEMVGRNGVVVVVVVYARLDTRYNLPLFESSV